MLQPVPHISSGGGYLKADVCCHRGMEYHGDREFLNDVLFPSLLSGQCWWLFIPAQNHVLPLSLTITLVGTKMLCVFSGNDCATTRAGLSLGTGEEYSICAAPRPLVSLLIDI